MSSNPIFLSISVVLNIILLALFFASYGDANKNVADIKNRENKEQSLNATVKKQNDEMNTVKSLVGSAAPEVGQVGENPTDLDPTKPYPDTVVGQIGRLIAEAGPVAAGENTMESAMRKMIQENNNLTVSVQTKQTELATKHQEYVAMVQRKDAAIKEQTEARTAADDKLVAQEKEHQEAIRRKDQTIAEVTEEKNNATEALSKYKAETDAIIEQKDERILTQSRTIQIQARKLRQAEDTSFERADGRIVFVDGSRDAVTINLGSADNLRVGTTFSVYTKDNSGIGRRNTEDIKASIEVTNIRGPHRADARIRLARNVIRIREDDDIDSYYRRASGYYQKSLTRPIAVGDPIYSPTFTSGEVVKVSFVGKIDLDNNGKSDRETIHNLMSASGAVVDNEIGDKGEDIVRQGINHETRFLVICDLGDPSKEQDPKKKKEIDLIQKKAIALREEALDNGTRIVTLGAFLDFMGYQPTKPGWVQGDDYKATLKAGAASSGVGETIGKRTAQGNVSGVHDINRRRLYNLKDRNRRHSGNVSGLYEK